jgi:hypothetical protein
MPVSYAVTCVLSTAVVTWWLASVGPKLLRRVRRAAQRRLLHDMRHSAPTGQNSMTSRPRVPPASSRRWASPARSGG